MITAWSFSLKLRRASKSSRTSGSGSGLKKVGQGLSGLKSINTEGKPGGLKACLRSLAGDLDLERSLKARRATAGARSPPLDRTDPPDVGLVPEVGVEPTAGVLEDLAELG